MKPGPALKLSLLAALFVSAFWPYPASAQNVSSETLRSVAAIVTNDGGGGRKATGTGFFVDIPSKAFAGNSFVYFVTARHNLLDSDGRPRPQLWVRLEDSNTRVVQDDPLPQEPHWILDPKDANADIAAIPYSPSKTRFSTIPISWFLNQSSSTTIAVDSQIGSDAYYLTMTNTGGANPRFVPVARFGKVSVAEPTQSQVPGAGKTYLCFIDGASGSEFSGAPVFLRTPEQFVFWGMMEARAADSSSNPLAGLVGVVPSSYIAETVLAMAERQESLKRKTSISN
jgi:hypothetical protein